MSSFQERLDQLRLDQSTVHPSAVQNLDSEINRTGAFPLNGQRGEPVHPGREQRDQRLQEDAAFAYAFIPDLLPGYSPPRDRVSPMGRREA